MTTLWAVLQAQPPQEAKPLQWGFPEDASATGGEIDTLFWIMTYFSIPLLVAVIGFVVFCLVRFREKNGRKSQYITGFRTAWGTATIVVILLMLELPMDIYQESVWAKNTIHFPDPAEATAVQVYAEQFVWNFRYAGKDGKFGTKDDLMTINLLYVPQDKPVLCYLRSRDVIHSFWLPHYRVKMDVVPGLTHRAWFQPTKPGKWEIACAELCGIAHYKMRAFLFVQTPAQHEEWLEEQRLDLEDFGPDPDMEKKWKLWDQQNRP